MTAPLSEQHICKIETMLSGGYTWESLIQHTRDLIASHRLLQQRVKELEQERDKYRSELDDYTF